MKIHIILKGEKDIYRNYDEAFFIQGFEKYFKTLDKKYSRDTKKLIFIPMS